MSYGQTFLVVTRRRYVVRAVRHACMTYDESFGRATVGLKSTTSCFTCGRPFEDGEFLDLLVLDNHASRLVCRQCSEKIETRDGVVFDVPEQTGDQT